MTVHKLFLLDRNTWSNMNEGKLFALYYLDSYDCLFWFHGISTTYLMRNPKDRTYPVLPLRAIANLGGIAIKDTPYSPKLHQIVLRHNQDTRYWGWMQLVYYTAVAERTWYDCVQIVFIW